MQIEMQTSFSFFIGDGAEYVSYDWWGVMEYPLPMLRGNSSNVTLIQTTTQSHGTQTKQLISNIRGTDGDGAQ